MGKRREEQKKFYGKRKEERKLYEEKRRMFWVDCVDVFGREERSG